MVSSSLNTVLKSISFYKKPVLYQVLIIALLSAVITGSLLTGSSVRYSLRKSAAGRLGNTGIVVSSGIRSFSSGLVQRINAKTGIKCTGIYELNGYCQSLNSQKGAFNSHIYAVDSDFFSFQGNDSIALVPGEIAINQRLADYLGVRKGDDLILRFREISDIPADAPFAPASEGGSSVVMKIGRILNPALNGNFSLSISQMVPFNIFMNLSDLEAGTSKTAKINRLLIDNRSKYSVAEFYSIYKDALIPSDIGLKVRKVVKTGGYEIISDRIFIDGAIVKELAKKIPVSAPVITYMANRITTGSGFTPYSFISALPASVYPEIGTGNSVIINRWLADDLALSKGDSVRIYWYSPDSLAKLIENSSSFIISDIVDIEGVWSDSLLMPDFPGISGSASCSDWNAGVPIKMSEIRNKDELYWNRFRGTPKAFINFEKGKELWGNNFGPATAIRFPEAMTDNDIISALSGSLDPSLTGFMLTDLAGESLKAANEGVDFGTLFLSLGFFLILASAVLLSFAVSSYFDIKKVQIATLFSLGFKNSWIKNYLFLETAIISLAGSLAGAFAGYFVNVIVTMALNSVWQGAVQTDTLKAYFSLMPVLTGFVSTLLFTILFMHIKVKRYLITLNQKQKTIHRISSSKTNMLLLIASAMITISLFALSLLINGKELVFSFAAGSFLLITFILFVRQYCIRPVFREPDTLEAKNNLSRLYYSFYPSHAVTPVLFIAAGIFAVFITGTNRMDFSDKLLRRSSGTGGYLLWCENTIPVKEDLNTTTGKIAFGIDDDSLSGMSFVGIRRSSGNDASCLNLNHITSPPLLGIDPRDFIARESFSFSKVIPDKNIENPWQYLNINPGMNTIYGIADQTVLDWGLKVKTGDTLIMRAENGQPLNIIIAAGLQSSVFQGYVIIGKDNFIKYYPSVSGNSVLLVDGNPKLLSLFESTLNERLRNYGVNIEKTTDRLASFYEVTNTYLSVFGVFGALGMVTGIGGLGFVLLRNYNHRKREFALMLATGFSFKRVRRIILSEQVMILLAGIFTGVISSLVATLPALKRNQDIPWPLLLLMILTVTLTGLFALYLSVRAISEESLTASLNKE